MKAPTGPERRPNIGQDSPHWLPRFSFASSGLESGTWSGLSPPLAASVRGSLGSRRRVPYRVPFHQTRPPTNHVDTQICILTYRHTPPYTPTHAFTRLALIGPRLSPSGPRQQSRTIGTFLAHCLPHPSSFQLGFPSHCHDVSESPFLQPAKPTCQGGTRPPPMATREPNKREQGVPSHDMKARCHRSHSTGPCLPCQWASLRWPQHRRPSEHASTLAGGCRRKPCQIQPKRSRQPDTRPVRRFDKTGWQLGRASRILLKHFRSLHAVPHTRALPGRLPLVAAGKGKKVIGHYYPD